MTQSDQIRCKACCPGRIDVLKRGLNPNQNLCQTFCIRKPFGISLLKLVWMPPQAGPGVGTAQGLFLMLLQTFSLVINQHIGQSLQVV